MCFKAWRRELQTRSINGMLGQSHGAMGVYLMRSATQHAILDMGSFARVGFENRSIIGYYNGTLLFQNLYSTLQEETLFGDGGCWKVWKEAQNYAGHVTEAVKFSNKNHSNLGILAAACNLLQEWWTAPFEISVSLQVWRGKYSVELSRWNWCRMLFAENLYDLIRGYVMATGRNSKPVKFCSIAMALRSYLELCRVYHERWSSSCYSKVNVFV